MCDMKGCKENAESCCMIADLSGKVYQRGFCIKCLKKMLWNIKDVIYEH